jgi:hypothetical protein
MFTLHKLKQSLKKSFRVKDIWISKTNERMNVFFNPLNVLNFLNNFRLHKVKFSEQKPRRFLTGFTWQTFMKIRKSRIISSFIQQCLLFCANTILFLFCTSANECFNFCFQPLSRNRLRRELTEVAFDATYRRMCWWIGL